MTYDLIFRNTIYGDVAVAGEQIAAVGEISENAPQEIDAEGKWLLPGGVDAHTHLNLTVGENSTCDGWEKGSAAALAGGTTTVIEHISFDPAGSCRAALRQAFIDASGRSCCDYGLHAVAQKVDEELLRTLPAAVDAGLPSWKAYTTYADPIFGEKLEELFRAAKEAGAVVCVHCEDDGLLRAARSKLEIRDRLSPEYHAASRPAYCEARSVREVLAAARRAGDAAVHIVHLSTAAGLHEIRHAREQGQTNITVETCPQYLLLDESLYRRGTDQALRAAMSPPLRTPDDAAALWQGLARGDIDMITTDHCAFSLSQKEQGWNDFRRTPNGAPGVEERLTLILSEGVNRGRITLEQAADLLSANPARRFGLTRKGRIAEGFDADLVLFDPAALSRFPSPPGHGGAAYSIYSLLPLQGRVEKVWLRGRPACDKGEVLARPGQGKYVERYLRSDS